MDLLDYGFSTKNQGGCFEIFYTKKQTLIERFLNIKTSEVLVEIYNDGSYKQKEGRNLNPRHLAFVAAVIGTALQKDGRLVYVERIKNLIIRIV